MQELERRTGVANERPVGFRPGGDFDLTDNRALWYDNNVSLFTHDKRNTYIWR